jgi:hypothetical protein
MLYLDHLVATPIPDSPRETELFLRLLVAGLYPKNVPAEPEKVRPDQG